MQNTTTTTKQNPSIGEALHTFKEGVKNPSLSNYRTTLEACLSLIQQSTNEHSYPVLQGIFENNKGFNDLISKVEIYFATNGGFKYYRYSKFDKEYSENFNLDFSKHDIRSLLILIRCYNISQGDISKTSNELIKAYQYIDANKKNKSLETLKNELEGISAKYIENRFKDNKYKVSVSGEYAKMINANLYLLSYNHKAFTQSVKHGRIHNVFTNLNRVYRTNELAFQLNEIDISSANPQIIDKAFGFDRWENVYANLMQSYNITRSEAKIKYNATLNNYKLSFNQAKKVYLDSGYSESESTKIATLTAESKKGDVYRFMAKNEGVIIAALVSDNFKDIPHIRLHDAIYYEPEFYKIDNIDYGGSSFGHETLKKANLYLNLKINTFKTVLTTPQNSRFIFKKYFNRHEAKKIYFGKNFTFYDRKFKMVSATFNINKPIISEDGVYSTPTESDFIERLERLYTILHYLNGNVNVFYDCIENMHRQEGLEFNKNYVYEYFKNYKHQDINKYVIDREWNYTGGAVIENHKTFNNLFHTDRRNMINSIDRPKLIEDLKELKTKLHQNQLHHIDKKNYYYANRYESGEIINKVNGLIGIKRNDGFMAFNKGVSLIRQAILNNNNIGCNISDTPIRKLMRQANISQSMATKLKYILSNKEDIIYKIDNAIQNIKQGNVKAIFEPLAEPQTINGVPTISPLEAFDYAINYTSSVFDTTRENAINSSMQFFKEWANHQTLKTIMQGARRGITQNYDNNKWRIEVLAVQMYKEHHPQPFNQAI